MRILALDLGEKTIGVALSDPFGWTAQGLETIQRANIKSDLDKLLKISKEYEIEKIILGLPLDTKGEVGPAAEKVLVFKKRLEGFFKKRGLCIEIEMWDESMTTIEAEEVLRKADLSRKKRKRVVDKLAAVMILKSYLEAEER